MKKRKQITHTVFIFIIRKNWNFCDQILQVVAILDKKLKILILILIMVFQNEKIIIIIIIKFECLFYQQV